jgi:hypothetical protein
LGVSIVEGKNQFDQIAHFQFVQHIPGRFVKGVFGRSSDGFGIV